MMVILGHTPNIPAKLYTMIYAIHIPLFFIVAGYLYNKEKYDTFTFKQVLGKKRKDILFLTFYMLL